MGRQKPSVNSQSEIIALQKSLRLKCKNIKVGYFDETGRGVKCKKKLERGDVLIALPLSRLITSESPTNAFSLTRGKFNDSQVNLTVLLIYENHLERESEYFNYLETLPKSYTNLYFCTLDELKLLPEFMRKLVVGQKENLKIVFDELSDKLKNTLCPHCQAPTKNFYTEEKFIWAWFTINTRSVYYEDESKSKASLALAPFLDMFNHSNDANTKMHIDFENELYVLKTLVPYKKNKEVFIKYGSHSNLTLLIDYGFVIANNPHDFIEFSFNKVLESIRELQFNCREMTKSKYDFIVGNRLNENLTKSKEEFSWNFNGLTYVLITRDENLSVMQSKIYSNRFTPTERNLMEKVQKNVAGKKLEKISRILTRMKSMEKCTESFDSAKKLVEIYANLLEST